MIQDLEKYIFIYFFYFCKKKIHGNAVGRIKRRMNLYPVTVVNFGIAFCLISLDRHAGSNMITDMDFQQFHRLGCSLQVNYFKIHITDDLKKFL